MHHNHHSKCSTIFDRKSQRVIPKDFDDIFDGDLDLDGIALISGFMGTVEEDPGFDEFRVTAGAGLRLTVPAMGPVPLAFDFAVPITREDYDETRVFSFYIGINR